MSMGSSKTSGLAIASLVFGVLVFCLGPFAAIPAIILGHLAHSGIRRSGGALGGAGLAIAGLVLGYFGLAVSVLIIPIMLPAMSRARDAAQRASCQNNLKQIGIACSMFANEHQNQWPQSLNDLYPEFLTDPDVLLCPSGDETAGSMDDIQSWTSYEYFPPAPGDDLATSGVCRDNDPEQHIPSGRNVLYADGHVEFERSAEGVGINSGVPVSTGN